MKKFLIIFSFVGFSLGQLSSRFNEVSQQRNPVALDSISFSQNSPNQSQIDDGSRDGLRDGPRDGLRAGLRDGPQDGPQDEPRDGPRDGEPDANQNELVRNARSNSGIF